MTIIDTHQHVFWHGRNDKDLVADMDEHGISLAWLLSFEIAPWENTANFHPILNPLHFRPDGTHAGIPLNDLITARDRFPSRFVLGYCPHPIMHNAPAAFEAAYKIHGVRVCGEWKFRIPFDDPRCIELYRVAGRLQCPVVLHLDVPYLVDEENPGKMRYCDNWYGGTIANLQRALDACPDTIFIGHAPGFWREISADADLSHKGYPKGPVLPGGKLSKFFDQYPNLYADLSANSALGALKRDPAHAQLFLTRYADRLLFARDYYGQDLHQFLQTLSLSQDVREKIYFKNAMKLVTVDLPKNVSPHG